MRIAILLPLILALSARSAAGPAPAEDWNWHWQGTVLGEAHGPFPSSYSGPHSLESGPEFDTSVTTTLFLGAALWTGAQVYADPEVTGGSGLSGTQGMAGVLNAETAHVGAAAPQFNLARAFVQQVIPLGPAAEAVASDQNQLAGSLPSDRLTVLAGKFSLSDYFDANAYAHDARTQFFNGGFVANAAWDYAADTKGYTWGALAELREGAWSLRAATALEPVEANGPVLDRDWSRSQGDNIELEWRHGFWGGGTLRLLAYRNLADMGSYADALRAGGTPDVTASRQERMKVGCGVNADQALGPNGGAFVRAGWNDGQTETWAYTEADTTATLGLQWKGAAWGRAADQWALAAQANGLSNDHRAYLAAGGSGFLLGDGALNYGPEEIVETYYSVGLVDWLTLTPDLQWVHNPGYNQDRGPLLVEGLRAHAEF
jgi:high affinity Mn2+ porin